MSHNIGINDDSNTILSYTFIIIFLPCMSPRQTIEGFSSEDLRNEICFSHNFSFMQIRIAELKLTLLFKVS